MPYLHKDYFEIPPATGISCGYSSTLKVPYLTLFLTSACHSFTLSILPQLSSTPPITAASLVNDTLQSEMKLYFIRHGETVDNVAQI